MRTGGVLAGVALLALAGLGGIAPIRAQQASAPPTSTVTATGPLPTGADLVRAMYAAVARQTSAHIVYSGTFEQAGVEQGTISGMEDVSTKRHRSETVLRTVVTPLSTATQGFATTETNIAVGHTQATRGQPGEPLSGQWTCEKVPGDLSQSYFIVYRWKHFVREVNHGSGTVDGQSVWDVRAVATWKQGKKQEHERERYYIAQSAPHLLVRELSPAAMDGPKGLIPYTMVMDYSDYGEPVHVQLPKVCRSKKH